VQLFLLRHADADTPAATDAARALSPKGHEQAAKVAQFCAARALRPELILSSPLVRAHQTAEAVARHLGVELLVAPFLASGMQPEAGVRELQGYERFASVMIVGHEPDFSSLIAHLLGISGGAHIHVRKASLTLLEVVAFRAASARLEFSIPCKLL
jgi:phosphohistidine phosphatase